MNYPTAAGIAGLVICSTATANCPNTLHAEQLIECITVEGDDEVNYHEWRKEFEYSLVNTDATDPHSTLSKTVPDVDIRTAAPAAGPIAKK